jgi:uroporphyrinogen-III synthase
VAETIVEFPQATGFALAKTHPHKVNLPAEVEAIILTSAAAVPAAVEHKKPIVAVGSYTAAVTEQAGLEVILSGKEDAQGLASLITANGFAKYYLAHLHGDTAQIGWHKGLLERGYKISSHMAYTTTWEDALPPEIIEALQAGRLRKVCLFSALAAEHLLSLFARANIDPGVLTAIVISPRVADAAKGFGCVKIARQPDRTGIRQVLEGGEKA